MLNAKEIKALLFITAAIEASAAEARKGSVSATSPPDPTLKGDPNSIAVANEAGLMIDEFYPRVLAAWNMNTPEAYPDPVVPAALVDSSHPNAAALAAAVQQVQGLLPQAGGQLGNSLTQLLGLLSPLIASIPTPPAAATVAGPGKAP